MTAGGRERHVRLYSMKIKELPTWMRFLDTDTNADVIALLNRMWGAASDDFKVQQ